METALRGMVVEGPQGRIGTILEVTEASGGQARLVVQRDDGQTLTLLPNEYLVDAGVIRLGASTPDSSPFRTQQLPIAGRDEATYQTNQLSATQETSPSPAIDARTPVEIREIGVGEEVVIPVIREEAHVERRIVERGGYRVHKRVIEREETSEQPTFREEVQVERVAIGRVIDQMPTSRQEGDTLVIPVVEEALIANKQIVLKEEIRLTRRRSETTEQQDVTLRTERVEVEQLPPEAQITGGDAATVQLETAQATDQAFDAPQLQDIEDGGEVVIPVIQEELKIDRRMVDRGGIRVYKRTEERQETFTEPTFREQIEVERAPVGQAVDAAPDAREEGDTLIIPVLEETVSVEKQLVLVEEIRITRRRVNEVEHTRIVVRSEEVEIEPIVDPLQDEAIPNQSVA